jgi:SM-20-related protein
VEAERADTEALLGAMLADGIAVCDGFVSALEVRALAQCAKTRQARGEFTAARIGSGSTLERREEVRGDFICWLTPPLLEPEVRLLEVLETLRLELNRRATLGLFDLELHYAWYPPGTGYARHIDRPRNRDARIVSVVLYLNEEWGALDGGALRCFDGGAPPRDIDPVGGRLVTFLSEAREHAVLPAKRPRLAATGWFRTRGELPLRG